MAGRCDPDGDRRQVGVSRGGAAPQSISPQPRVAPRLPGANPWHTLARQHP
jgi:hypothetical protein